MISQPPCETTIYTQAIQREDTSGESDVSFNRDRFDNLCLSDNSDDNNKFNNSRTFPDYRTEGRPEKRYRMPTPPPPQPRPEATG